MFKRSRPVSGQSGAEEMCNLYLMYYTLSDRDDFKICFDEEDRALSWKLPEGKSESQLTSRFTHLIKYST